MVLVTLALGSMPLTGCAVLRSAEDNSLYAVAADPLFVTPQQVVASIAGPESATPASAVNQPLAIALRGTPDQKKQFLGAVLLDSETKCSAFLNRLAVAQNGVNATGDVLTTVLSGVATAVAPISLSHGFSAASTIVSGTKTALDQDFWAKAGVQDFQKALATGYYASLRTYTDALEAQSDVNVPIEIEKIQSIHSLCTVSAAMNTISTTLSTGAGAPAAATAPSAGGTSVAIPGLSIQSYLVESQIRHSAFAAPTQTSELIRHWLWPNFASQGPQGLPLDASGHPATADAAHVKALRDWLARNPVGGQVVPIFTFVNSPALAGLRTRAVAEIPITPAGP